MTARTLFHLLSDRAERLSDKCVFSFVRGQLNDRIYRTYGELHVRASAIAAELQRRLSPGERAILLFPPGLDFIDAFFGCLYAGVVAVPVSPPRTRKFASSLGLVVESAQARIVLSTSDHLKQFRSSYEEVPALRDTTWQAADEIGNDAAADWKYPQVCERELAFLQFTSGSTASPKGVMLSHGNLLSNSATIGRAFGTSEASKAVFWLPLYHDMGLIGGVIQPVFCGGSCTLLAPPAFLQRPMLWLEAITQDQATISGGPDFAYDVCARKISADEARGLNLSSWDVAFTGAEAVRSRTLNHFAEKFAPAGFRRTSFFPCYGLAEATLIVSGGPRQELPRIIEVDAAELRLDRIREASDPHSARPVVSCGPCLPEQRLEIVNPNTLQCCGEEQVGEIWVRGPSVAQGYFGQPEMSDYTFRANLADGTEGPFLRTGDLGFLRNGELFVTGRLKDLIVIRGRNYYPEDIEQTVEAVHAGFRAGHCLAFSIDEDHIERLVVVQEMEPRTKTVDAEPIFRAVRRAIALTHGVEVHAIVLAKAGANPKTTSGKRRRSAGRQAFLNEQIDSHAIWRAVPVPANAPPIPAEPRHFTFSEIRDWLQQRISAQLNVPKEQVRASIPFLELGMGSLDAMEVATDLQAWLGRELSPTAIYNYPNVDSLARWLSNSAPEPAAAESEAAPVYDEIPVDLEDLRNDVLKLSEAEMEAFICQEMAKQQSATS